ncbi:creatininase family protein [Paenibacillus roseipurpureus]|uniref:Creatininase family protein n=1 Tax=Paenibacillus roseopurpureus TaxID=2918901 RepID=A0AA96LKX0_9BACL|nr:creatininase family protein [Paenibacillus sp. MBLB1832]WNR42976.1 creatininase family protein [Paenibacillus sp. MBLB1832]
MSSEVLWAKLYPKEWRERFQAAPIVYLPLGLCEPHGQIAVFGLDLIKAEYICEKAARGAGGIVAPSLGYHIHESGYHARWLEEQIGEENPRMTGMPPHVMLYFFLYQLRAFVNAGFKAIVVLSGHGGGNQADFQRAAGIFMAQFPVRIWVGTDGDLVKGHFKADHAGQFEISQLMNIDPTLVNMGRTQLEGEPNSGAKFARADNAFEASEMLGASINEACITRLRQVAEDLLVQARDISTDSITYDEIEHLWRALQKSKSEWVTSRPREGQKSVSQSSQWKRHEYPYTY